MGIYSHLEDISDNIKKIPFKTIYTEHSEYLEYKFCIDANYEKLYKKKIDISELPIEITKEEFLKLCDNDCLKMYGYIDTFGYEWSQIMQKICYYNNCDKIISYFICSDFYTPFYFIYNKTNNICEIYEICTENNKLIFYEKNIEIDSEYQSIFFNISYCNNITKHIIEYNYSCDSEFTVEPSLIFSYSL
jgi:hypothetical protein